MLGKCKIIQENIKLELHWIKFKYEAIITLEILDLKKKKNDKIRLVDTIIEKSIDSFISSYDR